jgi:PAS domain-containing protein
MSSADPERRQFELLQALSQARAYVRWLEGVVARNAALLGVGVDLEDQAVSLPPPKTDALRATLASLGMDLGAEDLSNYLGIEGDDASRPRLTDAPDSLRPESGRRVKPEIGLMVEPVETFLPLPGVPAEALPQAEAASLPEAASVPDRIPAQAPRPLSAAAPSGLDLSLLEENPAESDPILPGPSFPHAPGDGDPYAPPAGISPEPPDPGAEACFRAVLALAGAEDGVWDWNISTGAVFASRRWRELLADPDDSGLSPLETLACCLDPADVPVFSAACDGLLSGKLPSASLRLRFRRLSGGRFRGHLRAVCLRRAGQAVRLTAVLTAMPRKRTAADP